MKTKLLVSFNKDISTEPAEIRIYQDIGKDPWSGDGFDAEDFANALAAIPKNRSLVLRINSAGGSVHEGFAIKTLLDEWPAKKTARIDGVAASTASWIPLACNEVVMSPHAQFFIHDAWGAVAGNAKDMIEAAKHLDKTSDQIADLYAKKTGKSRQEMRDLMREGTLFNGEEAKKIGLVDSLTSDAAVSNFSPEAVAAMRNKLTDWKSAVNNSAAQLAGAGKPTPTNMKEKLIAACNKFSITVPENATEDQLLELINNYKPAAPTPTPAAPAPDNSAALLDLKNQIAQLTEANNAAKKLRIETEVQNAIDTDRVPANQKDFWVGLAMKDEAVLTQIAQLPSKPPGTEAVNASPEIKADAGPEETVRALANFRAPMNAWKAGKNVPMRDIAAASTNRAIFLAKNMAKIMPVMNTNTVDTTLKRDVILGIIIRDFVRRLAPLNAFSTVFSNVPLEGTNKVQVPFYDLDASASTSFTSGTGYTTIGNTTTDNREITVGQGATDGDRLFQALAFDSEEIARQPFLKIVQLAGLKAEKLALDIFNDVLSVVTLANYGAAAITMPAAGFDSDQLANLKYACRLWPEMGRSLMLDSEYDANLLKDPAIKHALNAASDSAIKEGRVMPRIFGFNYQELPTIPTNSENLKGFAVFQSAILVATAPVPPVQEVRNAGTTYELVTDPATGISFEYRTFGNNVTDVGTHVIECSYGFAKGNGNALKRIVSA